ncbi:hypothetical protein HMPREF1529_00142 [Microbacterium sp. oral taxon 186 str. F0373]|uniref:MBL fold metallo-hydrolase n=1 Tax=Microbacterium sp. oral taxon 186 TaxID=712383 RepID=UPI00034E17AC|nr:MBL fold metallo-hydrolase [Microbacterium sp. oral taxon 186]EPD86614.1 hypothetical protein HMPREF1529_00142 [Microbacterium sp. oral taxon 186 str. F0373]
MRQLDEVADGIWVTTSRRMATTSTVIVGGAEALLVDPAWDADELDALAAALRARNLHVRAGFATHAHHDHLLWHPAFGDVPRWASRATAALAVSERADLVAALGDDAPPWLVELMGRVDGIGDSFPSDSAPAGVQIEPVFHDGHAPGHTALWLPERRVLIAGDMLSDIELPLPFFPDDLPAYLDSLDRLAPLASRAAVIVPGHGTVGADALVRLDADRRYLDDMINRGRSDDPRVANPGMTEEHAHLAELAAAYRGTDGRLAR